VASPKSLWLETLLSVGVALNLVLLGMKISDVRLPGNDIGYQPAQPIAFSHRLHGGELQIPCLYCHPAAARARLAGTPSAGLCMNCHRFVAATLGAVRAEEEAAREEGREVRQIVSLEIQKIYEALGMDSRQDRVGEESPIRWIRIHLLPSHVRFHHGAHTVAGIDCRECHGVVERMERVRQEFDLSMGWCVECHRTYRGRIVGDRRLEASIDCGTCHH
jgi:hypothetical protein